MQWNALGTDIHGRVRALVFAEGTLYAGGSFDAASSRKVNNVAQWDALQEKWSTLGTVRQADLGAYQEVEGRRVEIEAAFALETVYECWLSSAKRRTTSLSIAA